MDWQDALTKICVGLLFGFGVVALFRLAKHKVQSEGENAAPKEHSKNDQ